jgi:outer membrane immunogenic protein
MTPLFEKRLAEFPADPEADIVADDRTSRGCSDDVADVERMAGASVYGSTDKDGLETGYNWQLSPSWVVGVETDIQLSNYSGTAIATPAAAAPLVSFTTQVSQASDWFGTLRGRLGFLLTPNILLFGTGGLAYGQTQTSFSTIQVGFAPGTCAVLNTCAIGRSASIGTGFAAGGGVEWMLAPHWALKAEYL